ncbi:DUF6526 family protein [Bacillus timonensis]|nr:DUF6526 family protein [Bacillus timonensis]
MKEQNYKTHRRFHPIYHIYLTLGLMFTLVLAVIHVFREESNLYSTLVMLNVVFVLIIIAALLRIYPLKAQDRAIRAEENLRHFALTGKMLDSQLSLKQVVALRFASDEEFPALAKEAAVKNLTPDEIKKAIKNWKADTNRI